MGGDMTNLILADWALKMGYIDDAQYKEYILQENNAPLPRLSIEDNWEEI